MRTSICHGHLVDPGQGIDRQDDLHIADGSIVAIGATPDGFRADREIDASGLVVCPGFVDMCARLREPGQEHKATIATETRAAVAGGITTLCVPPDTHPVIDDPSVVELINRRSRETGVARLVTIGALTLGLGGELLSEMAALKAAGCVGVGNAWVPVTNTLVMRRAMAYAATYDLTVFLFAEDPWLSAGGHAHDGAIANRMGLPGISVSSETAIVARDLALVEEVGVRAHFCRLSSARAVEMITRAQGEGLPVSADVSAHQLHLTDANIRDFNSLAHVRPPARTERDRDFLRSGVRSGAIRAVCSDHQPHEPDAKLRPFIATEPGISGLETLLPLTLSLVDDGMALRDAIARLTSDPARILGLEAGTLRSGAPADVCVFDSTGRYVLDENELCSSGRNTPFAGMQLTGRVQYTIVGGDIRYALKRF